MKCRIRQIQRTSNIIHEVLFGPYFSVDNTTTFYNRSFIAFVLFVHKIYRFAAVVAQETRTDGVAASIAEAISNAA